MSTLYLGLVTLYTNITGKGNRNISARLGFVYFMNCLRSMDFPRVKELRLLKVNLRRKEEPQLLPQEGEDGGQQREAEDLELTCEGSGGAA